ncbi:hypothetical protein [Hymenobacter nivis]|nr:hypothetical protein [Hymenobacter nivis]
MLAPFASARLRYRPLGPPDAAGLLALDGNPAALRYLGTPPLTSIG